MSVKHPQFILAVDARHYETAAQIALTGVDGHQMPVDQLVFRQRNWLEGDTRYRQLLPYVVLYKDEGGVRKYVAYRRTKAIGESRLAGNASIGFGGHIDMPDVRMMEDNDAVVDLDSTIVYSANRELAEEIVVYENDDPTREIFLNLQTPEVKALICDNSDEVGKVHIGLVIMVKLSDEMVPHIAESELEEIEGMKTAEELLNAEYPVENWSKLILQNEAQFLLQEEVLQAQRDAAAKGQPLEVDCGIDESKRID